MDLKISKEFSDIPGGRYIKTGPFSAEEFRTNILISKYEEALAKNEKLIIDFDGGYGYADVFLEEAFGGMIRLGYDADKLLKNIQLISVEEPKLIGKVNMFILESKEYVLTHQKK